MSSATSPLLDHFRRPRNAGTLDARTGSGTAENAACGDVVRIDVRVEDGVVEDARFLAQGCPSAVGAASLLVSRVVGLRASDALALDADRLLAEAGEPDASTSAKTHGARLALRALSAALAPSGSAATP